MTAFCRISERPIRLREPVTTPNAIVVQDTTLLGGPDLFNGLADDGFVLINTNRTVDTLGIGEAVARLPAGHIQCVAATEIARKHLGRPLPNAALLGGLLAMTGIVSLDSLKKAILQKFSGEIGRKNGMAAEETFCNIKSLLEAGVAAVAR